MPRLIPHDTDLGWTPWAWTVYLVPYLLTPLYISRYANPAGWAFFIATSVFFLALYFLAYWVRGRELILIAAARSRRDRELAVAIGAIVIGATLLFTRNGFGLIFGLLFGAALIVIARRLSNEVSDFILKFLTRMPGVGNIRSSFALKQVKYQTALPLPSAASGGREARGGSRQRSGREGSGGGRRD